MYWFLDDNVFVFDDGISADDDVPFCFILLEGMEQILYFSFACLLILWDSYEIVVCGGSEG